MNFEKNQYYSLFINENDSFLVLYKKYYKTFDGKCSGNKLNLYIVNEDLTLSKCPDDLYMYTCNKTENEKTFIYELIKLVYEKYLESVNPDIQDKYLCYLASIEEAFILQCEFTISDILKDYSLTEDALQKIKIGMTNIMKNIRTKSVCHKNADYNLDKLFDEFSLHGWLRFNQAMISHATFSNVDEIMLTKIYLNTGNKKIDLILSIDCPLFNDEILQNIFNPENLNNLDFTYYNGHNKDTINKLLNELQKNSYPVDKTLYTADMVQSAD